MQLFEIAPAGFRPLWVLGPILLISLLILLGTVLAIRPTQIEVSPEGLRLRNTFYGRTIPAARLQIESARRVDLATAPELAPALRTFGTGMPGYQSGWFRLKSGEKALVYLTDRRNIVYVPTADAYSLLLSPRDPDQFLSALRAIRR